MRDNRMVVKGAGLALLVALTSGCASIHDHRGFQMEKALTDSIEPGVDNHTSVEHALGQATFKSQFGPQSWYYISIDTRQKPFQRPRTTSEQILKIDFDPAGNVSTVGHQTLTRVPTIHPVRENTPTLGRHRSFFQDLFGNIGAVGALPGGMNSQTQGGGGNTGGGRTGTGPNGS
ncbi:outer membrane protein assembly factor BamE [Novosphingobium pituita]|jgi:outer membrane protein assembly factor BamE (lipoprotein component of BamABCDE complex)|uniref:Outer membrane protein assembly factor BamE n=1 Tax=Novosphingobium pituita TaxID=3056842 RepID=A0ABQ6PBZ2_9SPHN|nr:outer membrane protein assembly factor BamE [Novosphingobium sp. IK01]GMM61979.1 outer membrane protein assembly factor BamE [Novosphingobium sp. IK01]